MGTLKQYLKDILMISIFSLTAGYIVSEYVDYRVKAEIAKEMEIDKDRIYFLYNKEDKCLQGDSLYDSHHGVCIRK